MFNLENGVWVQGFETFLLVIAYTSYAFCFSFITYILIEAPFANVLNDFLRSKIQKEVDKQQHYRSQSAKAHLRDKSKKNSLFKRKKSSVNESSGDGDEQIEDQSLTSEDDKREGLIQKTNTNSSLQDDNDD